MAESKQSAYRNNEAGIRESRTHILVADAEDGETLDMFGGYYYIFAPAERHLSALFANTPRRATMLVFIYALYARRR